MIDSVMVGVATFAVVAVCALVLHRRELGRLEGKLQAQLEATNSAERTAHVKELEHLAERNKCEVAHADALVQARTSAFDEGRKHARSEHELEVSTRLAEQRNEQMVRLQAEREQAATEARERLRAEYELQTKLFSVKVSPYVQLLTDNGLFKNTYEARVGYQYQLLINGIPAFQPHVLIERHEKIEKIDEEIKKQLLAVAKTCAEAAVTTYLGASAQFAKLAPEIVDQVSK